MNNNWLDIFIMVLSGLLTTIPLVIKLVEYVKKSVKEKNWNALLELLVEYMETAETMFNTGAERKEWVLTMISASADKVNYDIDLQVIGDLIDRLCQMSKTVNKIEVEKQAKAT